MTACRQFFSLVPICLTAIFSPLPSACSAPPRELLLFGRGPAALHHLPASVLQFAGDGGTELNLAKRPATGNEPELPR